MVRSCDRPTAGRPGCARTCRSSRGATCPAAPWEGGWSSIPTATPRSFSARGAATVSGAAPTSAPPGAASRASPPSAPTSSCPVTSTGGDIVGVVWVVFDPRTGSFQGRARARGDGQRPADRRDLVAEPYLHSARQLHADLDRGGDRAGRQRHDSFSAADLPRGVSASFVPPSTTGNSTVRAATAVCR